MKLCRKSVLIVAMACGISIGCKDKTEQKETENTEQSQTDNSSITSSEFGTMPDGQEVREYTLKNEQGMEVSVINYGGRITHLKAPDKDGNYEDVVIGFDMLEQYLEDNPYFGALIGRYGNRIANGQFSLDGKEYQLPTNDGPNSLHGGDQGFDKVFWQVEEMSDSDKNTIKLTYSSADMEMGYPGKLETTVIYTLTDDNSLKVDYKATTDKKTVLNLTQHSYFNLSGDFDNPVVDHVVKLEADHYLPVNETLIPTGELRDVKGTPFDFREAKSIAEDLSENNDQLEIAGGYDHCWVLNDQDNGMRKVASAYHEESGRFMEVSTDQPAIQFYTGNFLDGTLPQRGDNGMYAHRTGFCLETQHYPDAPNQEEFPSTVLNPGETYETTTVFSFSTR